MGSTYRSNYDTVFEAQEGLEAFVFMDVVVVLDYTFSVYGGLCVYHNQPVNFSLIFLDESEITSVAHFPTALASFWIGRVRGCGMARWVYWMMLVGNLA